MSNVVQLNKIEIRPTDLLPIREYETKFGIKYDYLYKKSVIEGLIEPHYTPEWALSLKSGIENNLTHFIDFIKFIKTQ